MYVSKSDAEIWNKSLSAPQDRWLRKLIWRDLSWVLCVPAKSIVESVFKQIADAAQAGAETSIPSFGKFKVKDTPERDGRNPATGATMKIAASKKLTFTPSKAIKDALNG